MRVGHDCCKNARRPATLPHHEPPTSSRCVVSECRAYDPHNNGTTENPVHILHRIPALRRLRSNCLCRMLYIRYALVSVYNTNLREWLPLLLLLLLPLLLLLLLRGRGMHLARRNAGPYNRHHRIIRTMHDNDDDDACCVAFPHPVRIEERERETKRIVDCILIS